MTEPDRVISDALAGMDVDHVHRGAGQFIVTLPGTARLQTHCWLLLRDQTLAVQAFVCRRPDENREGVYRFMLQRNAKIYGVHYALDRVGDVHLVGKIARHAITADEIDTVLGSVLEAADGDFNTFLELGFASSIRREHAWRTANGESTANLAAFEHLLS